MQSQSAFWILVFLPAYSSQTLAGLFYQRRERTAEATAMRQIAPGLHQLWVYQVRRKTQISVASDGLGREVCHDWLQQLSVSSKAGNSVLLLLELRPEPGVNKTH